MKYEICMTALLFQLGTTASSYGRQEKQQEGHTQEEKSAQEHAKSAPQQHAQESKSAAAPHEPAAKPAAPQHTQSSAHSTQTHTTTTVSHATESHTASQDHGDGGNGAHGRISEAHYSARFGSEHSFHLNRGDYDHRRFAYGGYNFGFVQPWPVGWGYDDDVYVVYTDGGYYMYNREHPGLRLSINILSFFPAADANGIATSPLLRNAGMDALADRGLTFFRRCRPRPQNCVQFRCFTSTVSARAAAESCSSRATGMQARSGPRPIALSSRSNSQNASARNPPGA
jgi:hypothetical protein